MKNTGYNNTFITYDDDATWLVTYADLMTLLLVFFVLLYTLASFEKEKFKDTIEAVTRQLKNDNTSKGVQDLIDLTTQNRGEVSIEDITGLRPRKETLFKDINRVIKSVNRDEQIKARTQGGKIVIRISGESLFKSGSATLNPDSFPVIDRLIGVFNDYPDFAINIKGHTDNVPIHTREFPSNWELSAIRATTVLKYLIAEGISPDRLTATGYADIMPRYPNISDANRAKNRRVEFVLEQKEAI